MMTLPSNVLASASLSKRERRGETEGKRCRERQSRCSVTMGITVDCFVRVMTLHTCEQHRQNNHTHYYL